jgi:hypothetical protein
MHFTRYILATLASSIPLATMHTLDTAFTIEINGQPIARVAAGSEEPPQATVGTADNAAMFKLKDGVLECDGWMLGRNRTEDRSLLPKKVMWFKTDSEKKDQVHPVAVEKTGEEYKPTFHGMRFAISIKRMHIANISRRRSFA